MNVSMAKPPHTSSSSTPALISMSHGPTKIESKGVCIYCGRSGIKLTDEHIVPLSLGGQHIIREASCLACADITKKFELNVARGLWGDARISYDAPSRRKKLRKSHIELTDPEKPGRKIKIPYNEYPAAMIFYKMNRAGILEGLADTVDLSSLWELSAVTDDKKAKEFEQKFGMKLTVKFRHVPECFARLIAKIGYGQILYSLDPADFRSICVPYILGHKKNLSYIVGSSFDPIEPIAGIGYSLRTAGFGTEEKIMLIAEIRLYANLHTPTYHVVVGDVTGRTNIETVLKKIGDINLIILPPILASDRKPTAQNHWMPRVWPLPFWNI